MTPTETLAAKINRTRTLALGIGVVGCALLLVQLAFNAPQFFQSYLFAFMFWSGLTFGSLGISLLHNVVGGNWGVVIRRFLEAGIRTLPLLVILFLPLVVAAAVSKFHLYWWNVPYEIAHDMRLANKRIYLNFPFWLVRAVIYFAVWFFYGYRLLRLSAEQDRTGDPQIFFRMKTSSALGLLLFVITTSFAFIDWMMSIEPDWYSTIYPWMFTVGQVLLTFSFCVVLLVIMSRYRPLSAVVMPQHFHDLGNLMLAFTMLWTYMSLAQFLITWAENLPDEIPWYLRRFTGGFGAIAVGLSLFHFAVPFVMLLMRFIKRNPSLIYWVALWIMFVRMFDVYWIVMPAFHQQGLAVSWSDPVAIIGLGGIWMAVYFANLRGRTLLPLHDPRIGYHSVEAEA